MVLVATNVEQWTQNGLVPITFAQLLSGAGNEVQTKDAFTQVANIVGEIIWKRFYDQQEPLLADYVPFQMGNVLQQALQNADAQLKEWAKNCADYRTKAMERFKQLHEQDGENKKARSGPYE